MHKEKDNNKYVKIIYVLISIFFIVPSITYILSGKKILNIYSDFSFFYTPVGREITSTKLIGTILFVGVFIGLFILYIYMIKNVNKLFVSNHSLTKYIIIVSAIFCIMLPMTSTDVFYYIGTGWSEAKYKINPYYTSVNDILKQQEEAEQQLDKMLLKTPAVWRDQTIVYGPIWPMICKILSGLSFGNVGLALAIYKIFNLILHLINCYIIYKLTNKKKFVLLYALNPMVLFNGLCNVHNDILSIALILIALYFFKQKKNVALTVIFTALATAVKYYAILLIPFLIIYYYRKEKPLKRIVYSILWAILFVTVLIATYCIYMRDFEVLKGIMTQQNKFTNSIFLVFYINQGREFASAASKVCMFAFIMIYLITIVRLIFTRKVRFTKCMRTYNNLLIMFIFLTITGFQSWYAIWIFPTIMWQKGKMVNLILAITLAIELAKGLYFALNEWWWYGQYYYNIMLVLTLFLTIILNYKKRKLKRNEQIQG